MNWRYQYDNGSNCLCISNEYNDIGTRKYCNPDLLSFLLGYKRSIHSKRFVWHEKLGNYGRIVLDFDINRTSSMYIDLINAYPLNEKYEPIGYTDAIEDLIIKCMISLGRDREASILQRDKIEWLNADILPMKAASPFCWLSACRRDKISYHLTLPFITCIEVEMNDYGDIGYDGSITLQIAMKELYDCMELLSTHPYMLPDRSLLSKNHEIRLPGYPRYGDSDDTILRFIHGHNILHSLSCIDPSYAPSNLVYSVDTSKIYTSNTVSTDRIDDDMNDKLWDMIPMDIRECYSGLRYSNGIYYLVPIHKTTCCVCNREHDKNTPHITAYDGTYYITCWRWITSYRNDQYADGPIFIGHYGDSNMSDDRKRRLAQSSIDRYRCIHGSNMCVSDIPYDVYNDRDLYLRSAMGTGKTKLLQHILSNASSYIIISNRVTQAYKYHNTFDGTTLYGENGWTSQSVRKLVVQMESIHKICRSKYQYVILDEIESILRLLISSTMSGKEIDVICKLINMISTCDRVIVMDVFLKKSTVQWIKSIRSCMDNDIIVNTYKQIERSGIKDVHIYDKKGHWMSKLIDDSGKKVITCLSKSMANTIYTALIDKGESTLLITGDTDDATKRMDPHKGWSNYHNIVYTSAIANSISYEHIHFDTLYVYGCRGSAGPEELLQMMGRVRHLSDSNIHIYCSRAWYRRTNGDDTDVNHDDSIILEEYLPTNENTVMNDMRYVHRNSGYNHMLHKVWNAIDERVRVLYARLYVDRGCGQRYLSDILIHMMEHDMGWNIHRGCTYHTTISIRSNTVQISTTDREVYDSYIDNSYKDRDKIYDTVWCKNRSREIKNVAYVQRYMNNRLDNNSANIGRGLYNVLKQLFHMGNNDIDRCIRDRCNNVVLRYSAHNSTNIDYVLIGLGSYISRVPTRYKWEWLHNYICNHLLLRCDKKVTHSNRDRGRIYEYHIDMTDWIYYYII